MINHNFDPWDILEQIHVQTMSHDQSITELEGHYRTQAQLMDMMANQIKHLTTAIIGLQQQNKLLHQRLTNLEGLEP